jgi:hypothetical protein
MRFFAGFRIMAWIFTSNLPKYLIKILKHTLGEKLAIFIEFKNEILRPYGLRMTKKT